MLLDPNPHPWLPGYLTCGILSLQLVRQGFEAISQMDHPERDGTAAATAGGTAGGAAGGSGGVAVGPKLVVRLEAVAAIVQQAKALFKVEEEGGAGPTPDAAAGAVALSSLARREGGIIGSPDTL